MTHLKCFLLGKLGGTQSPGLLGSGHVGNTVWHVPKFRIPEGKEALGRKRVVCTKGLGTVTRPILPQNGEIPSEIRVLRCQSRTLQRTAVWAAVLTLCHPVLGSVNSHWLLEISCSGSIYNTARQMLQIVAGRQTFTPKFKDFRWKSWP